MRPRVRLALAVLAIVAALSLTLAARAPMSSPAAAVQIDLADILFAHGDYRGALGVYLRATTTEAADLRNRARAGAIRTALRIGEFAIASSHAATLRAALPRDGEALTLSGDSNWAIGLFDEAESAYREALEVVPSSWRARNGLAKCLASRGLVEQARVEAEAALASNADREPEVHHTLAQINESLRRYDLAADGYLRFLDRLPARDRRDRGPWTENLVSYLRSFRDRTPYELVSGLDEVHLVPFKVVRDKVVVKAKLNGKTMDFAVDTGAERTVVTVSTARRLGILSLADTMSAGVGMIGLRGLQLGVAASLEVGHLKLKNVPVLIKNPPLEGLPTKEIESLSPLALGFSMSLDYQSRVLTMARRLEAREADVSLPLRMHRLATVRGVVNGRPASFIVDTGGEVISLNTSVARSLFKPKDWRRIALKVYGASGWDPEAYLLPGVDLGFDEITYRNTPVVVMNLEVPSVLLGYQIGGTLGYKFLSRYRVDVDLRASEVRLKKTS
jgi:predicted aspartyl protease